MKAERKHVGTKAQIRAMKERERRTATVIFLAFILLVVAFSAYFTYTSLNQSQTRTISPASLFKAALVDHLSLTFPNQVLVETATNILRQANFTVDYYSSEKVNVEFYRNLPTHGYRIIILRTHSSASSLEGNDRVEVPVVLFTSEPYSTTKYINEQMTDQITQAWYNVPQPPYYFAISPAFVRSSMKGRFENTIIVMMGCEGLTNTEMAEAFVEKGAKVYVSWDGLISGTRNDPAIICLLQQLITERHTIKEAVANTMKEFGPGPMDNSTLLYYPPNEGQQTVETNKKKEALPVALKRLNR